VGQNQRDWIDLHFEEFQRREEIRDTDDSGDYGPDYVHATYTCRTCFALVGLYDSYSTKNLVGHVLWHDPAADVAAVTE
jgi:hypothetical protein